MQDHEKRELINRLTTIAKEFAQTEQLRERIAAEVLPEISAGGPSMNVSAVIFVYRHHETGEIKAQYINDPEPGEDWTHIETLDPAPWIAAHYNGRISSPKTTID